MHTCTHMKTNTATVQHAVVSGVESLTLAHKQASVQPSSPSPQTLACLNLAVRLISSLSTPTGLADAQLTAAFIRAYWVGVQLSRPQLCRRGISVETAQRVETDHPKAKIRLGCGYSGVRHLLGNTWHESGPELSQLFGRSVSTMDRDQAWPLSPTPFNRTNHEKTLERCWGCQRHFCKGCLYIGWGGQEILAEGLLATQQWLVVIQEKMHSHQLIPTVVGNWSAISSPQWSNFHCSPFSLKSSALVRFF